MRRAGHLPPLDEQADALRRGGLNPDGCPLYCDGTAEQLARSEAVAACGPGDVLHVASAAVFARAAGDALAALAALSARGASLRVAGERESLRWPKGAGGVLRLAQAVEGHTRARRKQAASAATRARLARKRERLDADEGWLGRRAKLEEMWADPALPVRRIGEETGFKPRTLYNMVKRGELPPRPPRGARRRAGADGG